MTTTEFTEDTAAIAFAEAGEQQEAKRMPGGSHADHHQGEAPPKKKPFLQTAIFGAISCSAYFLLFKNESLITETYTMGGWHAAFPVGTALFFSFCHGAFASNLLNILGIEAKK
ncbi:MAG: hypothetical protein P8Y63_03990 [Deltaproteobacteria bacterium]|jgi:hypothetical protein